MVAHQNLSFCDSQNSNPSFALKNPQFFWSLSVGQTPKTYTFNHSVVFLTFPGWSPASPPTSFCVMQRWAVCVRQLNQLPKGHAYRQHRFVLDQGHVRRFSVPADPAEPADPHSLQERYVQPHSASFKQAVQEVERGQKTSHWSWFLAPTPPYIINGAEQGSPTNRHYALRTDDQARAYLQLGTQSTPTGAVNLRENYLALMRAVTQQLQKSEGMTLVKLVGQLDDPKFRTSLRYFERISREIGDDEVNKLCKTALVAIDKADAANPKVGFCSWRFGVGQSSFRV